MRDSRVERLAGLLVQYSLELSEGDVVRLDGPEIAQPLLLALYRHALAAGAHPYLRVALPGLEEILLEEASEDQLRDVPPSELAELDALDAQVTVWADANTRALSGADPARQAVRLEARRPLLERKIERFGTGELAWCGTLFPTQAHAQDADMALVDYERFVYRACHVGDDQGDPVAHWRAVSADLGARAVALRSVRELRVLGEDTDLRVGVEGRTWIAADGRANMPDGEVFTSPVETETSGTVRFRLPTNFQGREVEDVRLRFEGGEVVASEAAVGDELVRSLLELDGARVLGEAAFGLNYEIDRPVRNILFDEKIGGTMHFALGQAFGKTGGSNVSGLHWDLICDLGEDGEVYADGELVWRAGRFLAEPKVAAGG